MIKETIAASLKLKMVKPHQLKRVNVDTTVQEKDIRFPTDARLYHRAWQRLVDAAMVDKIMNLCPCPKTRAFKFLLFHP